MLVRLGKRAGFCMGVRRALTTTLDVSAHRNRRVFTFGPLIHNTQVVDLLRRRRVEAVSDPAQVQRGDLIIIRAHGVPPTTLEAIRRAGGEVCDTTCPHVKRAQQAVEKAVAAGARVIIVGDRGHAEVTGLLGFAGEAGVVVENEDEAADLPPMEFAWVVAQTTQAVDRFDRVVAAVRRRAARVEVTRTICGSTANRQREIVELAKEVDVMVVVGGRHRANTVRLVELARATGVPTVHVETGDELDPRRLAHYRVAGVTAGASTPNWIIEEVVDRLREIGAASRLWAALRAVVSFLLISHAYVAGGAAALSSAACSLAGLPLPALSLVLAGLYLFSMQNLNMFLDSRGGEPVPGRSRRFYERYGPVLAPLVSLLSPLPVDPLLPEIGRN